MYDMEEQPVPEPEPYIARQGLIHFPDLLAPSTRQKPVEQYIEDYGYPRIKPKSPDSLFGSSFAYVSNQSIEIRLSKVIFHLYIYFNHASFFFFTIFPVFLLASGIYD